MYDLYAIVKTTVPTTEAQKFKFFTVSFERNVKTAEVPVRIFNIPTGYRRYILYPLHNFENNANSCLGTEYIKFHERVDDKTDKLL